MFEQTLQYLEHVGAAISLVAVVVIVVGFLVAAVGYLRGFRSVVPEDNFKRFKIKLGGALTLGLEILVLGDVIETITVKPTFQSLSFLAFLVVIRTVVSWTLTLEIEGRWPWQTSTEDQVNA